MVNLGFTVFAFFTVLVSVFNCKLAISSGSGQYSIQFVSIQEQDVAFQVTVNGVTASPVTASAKEIDSPWTNFSAYPNDILSIEILDVEYSTGISYRVNNGADGAGIEIYDSRITTFTPVNTCPDTISACEMQIYAPFLTGSTADFYINDTLVLQNFNGSSVEYLNVNYGDSIKVVFSYGGETEGAFYSITIVDIYNTWIYNGFGKNTLIDNPAINPQKSPFGGSLYPITQSKSRAFAILIGAGKQGTEWRPLTLPFDQ